MIPYIGDFAEDATVYHYFNTFDSNDPSASVTVTNLIASDIFVYKDGSVTDLVTDGATVVIDFDSRTGLHKITIDTSVHADYATGSDYMVMVNGITVDAATLNVGLFTFSIENRFNAAFDRLGAPAGASVSADIATIDSNVDAILVDTGTTLDTKLNDIQGATFNSSTDSLEALRDRGDSAWTGSATTSDSGTAQAGAAGSITLQSGASATDNLYNGQVVYISSGTGAGQSRAINGYTGSSKVATVITNWTVTPDATSVYEIYPDEITEISAAPTAATVADAVWDEATAGHTNAGSFGEQLKNDVDAILTDTGTTIPNQITTAQNDLDIITGATGVNLLTATQASIDAIEVDTSTTLNTKIDTIDTVVDGIQTDLSNATDGLGAIKTDTAAIKTKTDSLTFTQAGEVDANVQSINNAAVTGDGNGTPWDGA